MSEPSSEGVTVVIAGNYQQFRRWCAENQRSPVDRRTLAVTQWRDAQRMRGLAGPRRGGNARLVRVGTWEDIPGLDEIRATALACGFDWTP